MDANNTAKKELTGHPSIDKPWLKHYEGRNLNVPLPDCTVYEYVYQHNKDYLTHFALEYFGTKIDYKKLFEQVDLCAKALKANGINKGGIVNICSSGIPEIVYLVLACSKIGAVANFVNPLFETQQKIDRINDTDSDTLFVMDKMYSYIKDVIGKTCLKRIIIIPATNSLPLAVRAVASMKEKSDKNVDNALKSGKFVLWNSFIKSCINCTDAVAVQYQKDMPVIMVYSSGTTGVSKAIQLTNDSVNFILHSFEISGINFERNQRYLHIVPPWFSTGIVMNLLLGIYIGMTTILEPVFDVEAFVNDLIKYKPTHMIVATSIWLGTVDHPKIKNTNFPYFILPMSGGEALSKDNEKLINDFLLSKQSPTRLAKGYGMCELGSAATAATEDFNKIGSVGIPLPKVVISAFDIHSGEELKYNERGELRVLTPGRMLGYFKNDIATAEYFNIDANGNVWGCTGDIGYVDEDGFVFVLGRASDYFISPDGERHYLFDAENVILKNDSVDLCEVVTVMSKKLNREIPVAHIVLKKDFNSNTDDLIQELDKLCRGQLSEHAVPVGYKIRKEFAIKPSGKRDTLSLKNEYDGFMSVSDGKVKQISID